MINTLLKQRCCFTHRDGAAHFPARPSVRVFEETADKQRLFQAVEATSLPWWVKQILLDALTLKSTWRQRETQKGKILLQESRVILKQSKTSFAVVLKLQ